MINRILVKEILYKVGGNICPVKIPRSGDDGKNIRCYSTIIEFSHNDKLLVNDVKDNHVIGWWYCKESCNYSFDASIAFDAIKPENIIITQYIGYCTVTYNGLWSFIKNGLSGKEPIKAHLSNIKNDVLQFIFNKKQLQSKKRMELLEFIVDRHIDKKTQFDVFSLMTDIYSLRCFGHPDKDVCQSRLQLYLDSFKQSGEIEETRYGYKLIGKSVVTLESYQDEERRHKNNVKLQHSMVILTLLLAMLASVQAGLVKLKPIVDLTVTAAGSS